MLNKQGWYFIHQYSLLKVINLSSLANKSVLEINPGITVEYWLLDYEDAIRFLQWRLLAGLIDNFFSLISDILVFYFQIIEINLPVKSIIEINIEILWIQRYYNKI